LTVLKDKFLEYTFYMYLNLGFNLRLNSSKQYGKYGKLGARAACEE